MLERSLCFPGSWEGEGLPGGAHQPVWLLYPLNTFSNIHTHHIYNASKSSQNFAVFHRADSRSSPKHRKTQQTIKFHCTVLIFYAFPPVQIKHHVGGIRVQ